MHQDAAIYTSILGAGDTVDHVLNAGRHVWLQVARGDISVNGERLGRGDGAGVSDERRLAMEGRHDAEILLFDVA